MDLVASAIKLLTPELTTRIASTLGIDRAAVEKAVDAGIPGLLAAFIGLVGKPGGMERLSDAVSQVQPGVFTNLANMIGGAGTPAGPVVGPLLLTVVRDALRSVSPVAAEIAFGAFLIAAIAFLPAGLMGALRQPPPWRR